MLMGLPLVVGWNGGGEDGGGGWGCIWGLGRF